MTCDKTRPGMEGPEKGLEWWIWGAETETWRYWWPVKATDRWWRVGIMRKLKKLYWWRKCEISLTQHRDIHSNKHCKILGVPWSQIWCLQKEIEIWNCLGLGPNTQVSSFQSSGWGSHQPWTFHAEWEGETVSRVQETLTQFVSFIWASTLFWRSQEPG